MKFETEFLHDSHVRTALQEVLKTLPLTNLKNKESFAVGIHAFKLHIDPTNPELLRANATAEGVHRDGAEMIMINFAGSKNVRGDSAKTYLWTNEQPLGHADLSDPQQLKNLITVDRLNEPGDYFILSDQKLKHCVSEILQCDKCKPTERKVMVIYIRDFKDSDVPMLDTKNPLCLSV
jgi:hypothetical protein